MKADSIVFTIAGMCFGVILGWVLATLDSNRSLMPSPAAVTSSSEAPPPGNDQPQQTAQLDEAKVQALTTILKSDPENAGAAAELAETYFRAERMDEAIKWFREALRLNPKNVEASTQLGMSLFVVEGADAALAQFDAALRIDPDHPRALLSKGIVLWQGKRDLEGAAAAWRHLVKVAPASPEAEAAQEGLKAVTARGDHGGTAPVENQ